MKNKLQRFFIITCLAAQYAVAVPLTYDETIIITNPERPITFESHGGFGTNPFVFHFTNTPLPTGTTINITVFGEGDFDGAEDADIWGAGFQETLAASMEAIGLAYNGSTKLGPFSGSRSFLLSNDFGWSTFNFNDGLMGTIFLAQGVGQNLGTDFLAMRVQYTYEGMAAQVPVPSSLGLLGLGLILLRWGVRRDLPRSVNA